MTASLQIFNQKHGIGILQLQSENLAKILFYACFASNRPTLSQVQSLRIKFYALQKRCVTDF